MTVHYSCNKKRFYQTSPERFQSAVHPSDLSAFDPDSFCWIHHLRDHHPCSCWRRCREYYRLPRSILPFWRAGDALQVRYRRRIFHLAYASFQPGGGNRSSGYRTVAAFRVLWLDLPAWVYSGFDPWLQRMASKAFCATCVRVFRSLGQRGRPVWAFLDKYLRFMKYGVLVWAVTGAAIYGVMVFRDYDPWSALINIAEWTFTPGLVVLGLTLVGSLFVERPWCRYACPLGAASGLLGKLSPIYIKREAEACTSCKICTKACPMGLQVHTATVITSVDCISCLECVGECPREGAMEVKAGIPLMAK